MFRFSFGWANAMRWADLWHVNNDVVCACNLYVLQVTTTTFFLTNGIFAPLAYLSAPATKFPFGRYTSSRSWRDCLAEVINRNFMSLDRIMRREREKKLKFAMSEILALNSCRAMPMIAGYKVIPIWFFLLFPSCAFWFFSFGRLNKSIASENKQNHAKISIQHAT